MTQADVTDRIETMRGKKPFSDYTGGWIDFRVFPIEAATKATEGAEATYSSFAVAFSDGHTDYRKTEIAERFDDDRAKETLSAMVWGLTRAAMLEGNSLDSVSNFSSQVSRTMQWQAAKAMFLSLLAVVIYIWVRFGSLRYGIAAIVALVHDVTIALGAIAVSALIYNNIGAVLGIAAFRIDLSLVAAMLTIVGYSLNDTIVVFDRIRENKGKLAEPTPAILNESLNQTISRTVLTSVTTLLALLVLYILGGGGSIHGFAFAMVIGVLVGTYSSVGVASPLIMILAPKTAEGGETRGRPVTA
jgi:SecD/SecF fusion protein